MWVVPVVNVPVDLVPDPLSFDDGAKIEGKGVWHKINGHIHHWNDPHEGSKYSIVLYRRTRTTKSNRLVDAMRAKRAAAAAANQTAPQSENQAPCTDPSSETSA